MMQSLQRAVVHLMHASQLIGPCTWLISWKEENSKRNVRFFVGIHYPIPSPISHRQYSDDMAALLFLLFLGKTCVKYMQ